MNELGASIENFLYGICIGDENFLGLDEEVLVGEERRRARPHRDERADLERVLVLELTPLVDAHLIRQTVLLKTCALGFVVDGSWNGERQ